MNETLVERLRLAAEELYPQLGEIDTKSLITEAADEIERLHHVLAPGPIKGALVGYEALRHEPASGLYEIMPSQKIQLGENSLNDPTVGPSNSGTNTGLGGKVLRPPDAH